MKKVSFDIETYKNYTLFAFRGLESQKIITIEIVGEHTSLTKEQRQKLSKLMQTFTTVTFNGNKFDIPLTRYAIDGATASQIQQGAQEIITSNAPDFITYKKLGLQPSTTFDTIDLQEPAPAVFVSLKNTVLA